MLPGKRYDVEDVLNLVWRRKWLLLTPAAVVAALVTGFSMTLPNRYVSETLILLVPQRIPESYVRSTVTARIEDRLRSISQQILSRTRLERIIADLHLFSEEVGKRPIDELVDGMRKDIRVETVKDDAFRVSFTSNEPGTAMRVTERLASLFIEENMRDREVLADGTNAFLESQLEAARARLVDHEKKLEEYRMRFAGQLPTQLQSNLQAIQNTQLQLQALIESSNRDHDRRAVLERLIADTPAAVDAAVDEVKPTEAEASLAAARRMLRETSGRLTPEHPDVRHWTRVVRDLERTGAAAPAAGPAAPPSPVATAETSRQTRLAEMRFETSTIDRRLAASNAEAQRLRSVISTYQARVDAAPLRESELVALSRDYETLEQVYRGLLAKREDSRMAANLERRQVGEQFKVLDAAQLPRRPSAPDRPRMALFGAFFGLCLGAALSTLLEYHDSQMRSDEDVVTSLSLPVVAMIPAMIADVDRRRGRRRTSALVLTTLVTIALSVAGVLWGIAR